MTMKKVHQRHMMGRQSVMESLRKEELMTISRIIYAKNALLRKSKSGLVHIHWTNRILSIYLPFIACIFDHVRLLLTDWILSNDNDDPIA